MRNRSVIPKSLLLFILLGVTHCGEETVTPQMDQEVSSEQSLSSLSEIVSSVTELSSNSISTDFLIVDGLEVEIDWFCNSNIDRHAASSLGDVFMNMSFDKGWTGTLQAGPVADPPCTVQLVEDATFGSNFEGATGSCSVTQSGNAYLLEADVYAVHIKNGSIKHIQMSATCEYQ